MAAFAGLWHHAASGILPLMFHPTSSSDFEQFSARAFRGVVLGLVGFCQLGSVLVAAPASEPFTNLLQIVEATKATPHLTGAVHLRVTVCAASSTNTGIVAAQDATAAAVLDLGPQAEAFVPGEQIRIDQTNCLVRRRDFGVQISVTPLVDNDGIHSMSEVKGETFLTAGRHPLTVEWFNALKEFGLIISVSGPEMPRQPVPATHLCRQTDLPLGFQPGLDGRCFEGNWDSLPDFNLQTPVRTGVVANFDLGLRTRDERVGLRFTGFFDAPRDGNYVFQVASDDGATLSLGRTEVAVAQAGLSAAPVPVKAFAGEPFRLGQPEWMAVEGRVNFATQTGKGLEFQVRAGYSALTVRVVDAEGLTPVSLLNSLVRVSGVGRGVFNVEGQLVLGKLSAASGQKVEVVDAAAATDNGKQPLTTVEAVRRLNPEAVGRQLPVNIRGVITSAPARFNNGLTLQDGTGGIYVTLENIPYWIAPAVGEFWEIEGHTALGNFAPVVAAEKLTKIGPGQLPEPVQPSWNQLADGSLDVQWVQWQGLVTGIHSNTLAMLLPDGSLDVQMVNYDESDLNRFKNCVVCVRGTLFADWNAATREVRVGELRMENASISVEKPASGNLSDAVAKNIHDLLLFDAQAAEFQRVKVRGQLVHVGPEGVFLQQGDAGLRIDLQQNPSSDLAAGDGVEAIGYPTIIGPSPILHEAVVEKLGHADLPQPRILQATDLKQSRLDATRVRLAGRLNGWHWEGKSLVLEMTAGTQQFFARLDAGDELTSRPRAGSRLALTGTYSAQGGSQRPGSQVAAFELLLNSPADVVVLSQPSWWTLPRLLGLVGVLLFILVVSAVWITQLRRQVERRTRQLRREIHEREQAEKQRALEAERSRIARDLHDDLGSSLAEIAMLAKTRPTSKAAATDFPGLLDAITGRARGLIAALDVIVWAVDPEENSLQSLADYLTGFVDEYLSQSGIVCRFDIPMRLPEVSLDGRLRHDLFLAVKEALHNVVRHSRATELVFTISCQEPILEIQLADNGLGFATNLAHDGHGVKNLADRLKTHGGICQIESRVGGGTTVKIQLSLTATAKRTGED